MEPDELAALPQAYLTLLDSLGIDHAFAASVEQRDLVNHEFPTEVGAVAETPAQVALAFVTAFDRHATVNFKIGAQSEFTLAAGVEEAQWEDFRSAANGVAYQAAIKIDKAALLAEYAGVPVPAVVAPYLTSDAAAVAFRRGLDFIERSVWQDTSKRLVVILFDADHYRSGDAITVLGCPPVEQLVEATQEPVPQADRFKRVTRLRARYVTWEHQWTRSLTPWHFAMPVADHDTAVGALIDACFVRLTILFTCDRARALPAGGPASPAIVADYRGGAHVASITLFESAAVPGVTTDRLVAVRGLVDWCYDFDADDTTPDWVSDRLPFIQTKVAQGLEGREESERLAVFVAAMPDLRDGVAWHWKAFIEGRVSAYLDKVGDLEDAVAETVDKFAARASDLVAEMSKTMLAAVGVLIGTFIAAAFQSTFNERLFEFGIRTYASYVFLFPFLAALWSSKQQMAHSTSAFDARRNRFNDVLYRDKVDEIVGTRVDDAKNSYWRWFIVVGLVYLALIVALLVGAEIVPDIVGGTKSTQAPS